MKRITIERFFNGETIEKYGKTLKKMDKTAARNSDDDAEFAYQSKINLGPYKLELHTMTKLVNITDINKQLNAKLGQQKSLRGQLATAEIANLINAYKENEIHTLMAIDEEGQIWAYRTIGAKIILARDKSVDKEVLERLFEDNMTEIPNKGMNAFTDLARKRAGCPKDTHWDKIPGEAKNFAHRINNAIKAHFGIKLQGTEDLGTEFHIRRKAICNFIEAGLSFKPDMNPEDAVALAIARIAD